MQTRMAGVTAVPNCPAKIAAEHRPELSVDSRTNMKRVSCQKLIAVGVDNHQQK